MLELGGHHHNQKSVGPNARYGPDSFFCKWALEMSHLAHIHHKDHSKQKAEQISGRPDYAGRCRNLRVRGAAGCYVHCALCGPGRQGPLVLCNNRQEDSYARFSLYQPRRYLFTVCGSVGWHALFGEGAGFAEPEYRGFQGLIPHSRA